MTNEVGFEAAQWDIATQFFIQWKGTDVCMDLHCPACSYHNHYDGYFAYIVQCAKCKALYKLPELLPFKRIDAVPEGHCAPLTCEYEPDEDDSPDEPTEKS
jgi:hypothetical protein